MEKKIENKTIHIELYCRYKEKRVSLVDLLNVLLKQNEEKQEVIDKAIEYITSEETINMFSSINAREKWLKINHKILNILQGSDK